MVKDHQVQIHSAHNIITRIGSSCPVLPQKEPGGQGKEVVHL